VTFKPIGLHAAERRHRRSLCCRRRRRRNFDGAPPPPAVTGAHAASDPIPRRGSLVWDGCGVGVSWFGERLSLSWATVTTQHNMVTCRFSTYYKSNSQPPNFVKFVLQIRQLCAKCAFVMICRPRANNWSPIHTSDATQQSQSHT